MLVRFALPVSLCVGLLLAASIDGWWDAVARWRLITPAVWRRRVARIGIVVLVAGAFVPLIDTYSVPFRVTTATVPPWFEHGAPRMTPHPVPPVLTVPFAYGMRVDAQGLAGRNERWI